MADHDGEAQFEAEANILIDKEDREEEAKRLERQAAKLRAETVLGEKSKGGHIITEDGSAVQASEVAVVEKEPWKYGTLEYLDDIWEFRVPKPLAAMFLGAASRKKAKAGRKIDAIMGYLEHVLSEDSLDRMMERAQDHDDVFDTDNMAELVRMISSEGSARPTGSIQR